MVFLMSWLCCCVKYLEDIKERGERGERGEGRGERGEGRGERGEGRGEREEVEYFGYPTNCGMTCSFRMFSVPDANMRS